MVLPKQLQTPRLRLYLELFKLESVYTFDGIWSTRDDEYM